MLTAGPGGPTRRSATSSPIIRIELGQSWRTCQGKHPSVSRCCNSWFHRIDTNVAHETDRFGSHHGGCLCYWSCQPSSCQMIVPCKEGPFYTYHVIKCLCMLFTKLPQYQHSRDISWFCCQGFRVFSCWVTPSHLPCNIRKAR